MKKKFFILCFMLAIMFTSTACGQAKFNLKDYVIEERENLFVAQDDLYALTLSCGMRESNYCLDGVKTDMVEFGVLTLTRLDHSAMANDKYSYIITVGDNVFEGELIRSEVDNSCVADLQTKIANNAEVSAKITFTGHNFDQTLQNVSNNFKIDKTSAINIANKELKADGEQLKADGNIEVITKIMADSSSVDNKSYYWYVGVISTEGDTLGLLIDANSGDIIAKKV